MEKINKTKLALLMVVCTAFTSLGQFFFKLSAKTIDYQNINSVILNFNLFLALFFYGIATILMVLALKYGELSFVYPFISLSFIWVLLISYFYFHEPITLIKGIGMALIMSGIITIGIGASKSNAKTKNNKVSKND